MKGWVTVSKGRPCTPPATSTAEGAAAKTGVASATSIAAAGEVSPAGGRAGGPDLTFCSPILFSLGLALRLFEQVSIR